MDEPDAVYGLVAESGDVAPDKRSVVFKMRPEAKFADGTPITADDVVFTFNTLKEKGHPNFTLSLRDVAKAEAIDPHTVRYEFKGDLIRDLPLVVAELPILSKAFYTKHPFDQSSLEKPLGSGPYEIGSFKPGTYVTYKRRPDYWAKDLPVNRGRFNFDEVRYEYYRDRTLELEGLKSAAFDFREEFTSIDWATGYDIPAVREGRLVRLIMPDERPSGAQGFFINTRREPFKDKRVREALGLAFDFEWSNKNLFFELYKRTQSFFENSDMKAKGLPSPEELALLEPFKDKLAPEVFGEPVTPPVTDASGRDRQFLKRARDLLTEAGYGDGGKPLDRRDPVVRGRLRPHHHPLRQQPEAHRRQRLAAPRRPGAVRAAHEVVRLRHVDPALRAAPDAGRRAEELLGIGCRRHGRQLQPRRHQGSRGRRAHRQDGRSQITRRAGDGGPRTRPRAACRSLLGAAVV